MTVLASKQEVIRAVAGHRKTDTRNLNPDFFRATLAAPISWYAPFTLLHGSGCVMAKEASVSSKSEMTKADECGWRVPPLRHA